MFDKLFGAKKKTGSGHPLASAQGLSRLIADLPGDDDARLKAVSEWLEEIPERAEELGGAANLDAVLALDAASWPARERMLESYFRRANPSYGSTALLERLSVHLGLIETAYCRIFATPPAQLDTLPSAQRVLAGARGLSAWQRLRRIGRFRNRPLGQESWRKAHLILQYLMRSGIHRTATNVFPGTTATSPLHEYLVTVFEETVPWGNLMPAQAEVAARLIETQEDLSWLRVADDSTTHYVDLARNDGPRRYAAGAVAAAPGLRFLSTIKLHAEAGAVGKGSQATAPLPARLVALQLEPDQLAATMRTLASYWSPHPPERQSARAGRRQPMVGAFGFAMARQLVEATQNVGKGLGVVQSVRREMPGRTFQSEFNRAFSAYGYGTVARAESAAEIPAATSAPTADDSLQRISNLESAIADFAPEHWTEVDVSDTGMGVMVPALLPRHAAGALVAWRESNSVQWHLGIVRRVARDGEGKPTLGLELIAGQPLPAVLHLLARHDAGEWILVIAPDAQSNQVFAPAGTYVADMPLELISDLGQRNATMKRLLGRAGDWDRIEIA